jgi:hypothetical protein
MDHDLSCRCTERDLSKYLQGTAHISFSGPSSVTPSGRKVPPDVLDNPLCVVRQGRRFEAPYYLYSLQFVTPSTHPNLIGISEQRFLTYDVVCVSETDKAAGLCS